MRPLALQGGIYTIVFVIAALTWGLPEVVGSFFQRPRRDASRRDRGSFPVVMLSMWIGLAVGFALADRLPGANIQWNPLAALAIGIAVMLGGVLLRWYSIRVLGTYFTRVVTVHANQLVIQTGPYRWIRHPTYSGTLLTLVGIGLALGNWAALIAILLGGLIGHLYRIRVEEQGLADELGSEYVNYMRQTKRLIPFLW